VNPFVYPKSKHSRRERPGQLARYQLYKPYLRREFAKKCVYCRLPDTMGPLEAFGVDHYRPKKKFPHLVTAYANLFYCCNPCNRRKGEDWPRPGEEGTEIVPNPCDHKMSKHLRFKRGTVESLSPPGAHTLRLLDLNDPKAVAYREFILATIGMWQEKLESAQRTARELRKKRRAPSLSAAEGGRIDSALSRLEHIEAECSAHLDRLAGGP